jgi:predicted transcriptional regulator
MDNITVKALMQKNPAVLKCNTPLADVVNMLLSEQVSGLLVVNNDNKVLGFVSELTCHKVMLISSYHCDKPVIVDNIMTDNIVSIHANDYITDVAISLQNENSDVYAVIEHDKLIGILTRHHLLKALNDNLSSCSHVA